MHRIRLFSAAAAAVALTATLVPVAHADDYTDPDYAAFDADQAARTSERQGFHLETAEYGVASFATFGESFLSGIARQQGDVTEGRIYGGLGQALPGGNVGDPQRYEEFEARSHTVEFTNREGTNLVGRFWPCNSSVSPTPSTGPCPLVVVTTGSIQVTQNMYGWLASHLQDHAYTVFTYDVRGQGESETTTPGPIAEAPFVRQGANPQDGANFHNGTVDAMRYALSRAHEFAIDPTRIGLIGHSLGASAVSIVQQCSDAYPERMLPADVLPAACDGEHFPIKAVVAYDSLSNGWDSSAQHATIAAVVPAFDHRADGYFINWVPEPTAPTDHLSRLTGSSAYASWKDAGVATMSVTVRAGTHAEWTQIPYIVSATRYGVPQSQHYSLAWLDRFLSDDLSAVSALADFVPGEPAGQHLAHRATLMSVKYASGLFLPDDGVTIEDFRAAAAAAGATVAQLGDWAAANAEAEYGLAPRGAVHAAVRPASS